MKVYCKIESKIVAFVESMIIFRIVVVLSILVVGFAVVNRVLTF